MAQGLVRPALERMMTRRNRFMEIKVRHVQEAALKLNYHEVQGDNLEAVNKDNILQEQGNKVLSHHEELMDTDLEQVLLGQEDHLIQSGGVRVKEDARQVNSKGQTFTFNAEKDATNSGGESQTGKRWKRAVRSTTGTSRERLGHTSKVSGTKRVGSKELVHKERKKCRQDGELFLILRDQLMLTHCSDSRRKYRNVLQHLLAGINQSMVLLG
ncbi:hypothetical protein COLO4_22676 [Corchorus olitorius]|uniref:Uncharacterized protein n=1 Tax=Corchorus olitorius TaxID=93759 RepID=A0A1R3IKK9_9ROSI|nr:hypothetical protein COLO4_22676 [Corchorus olitorius]